jgi:hypothetical protein
MMIRTLVSAFLALSFMAGIAAAEYDTDRSTYNAKHFYKNQDLERP